MIPTLTTVDPPIERRMKEEKEVRILGVLCIFFINLVHINYLHLDVVKRLTGYLLYSTDLPFFLFFCHHTIHPAAGTFFNGDSSALACFQVSCGHSPHIPLCSDCYVPTIRL